MNNFKQTKVDIIVVGAGHAGCEAALSAAKLGAKVLLATLNLDNIALMPCNPAIGGPAKSALVREIDALGGAMAIAADASYLQMKILNSSKGPAVRALRAQSDKKDYMSFMRNLLENNPNILLKQCNITDIAIENGKIKGAIDELGIFYEANSIILTTGTSLNGKIWIGLQSFPQGRLGEIPAIGLSACLKNLGFTVKKLKTGTPCRVDGRTINYDEMIIQPGDKDLNFFSFLPHRPIRNQFPCYLTKTNAKTHDIIKNNLDKSPMFTGLIQGIGPRYCPSIEDKIVRFPNNPSHHIFIEPEGKNTYEVYVQGFSSSLPAEIQIQMLKTLPGMQNVHVIKPAYAVEYDYLPAVQLQHSLMTKRIQGLFCAGQINGTSGYEEAAAQGLVAGINATRFLDNKELITLSRASSYIGTLIDDLVTKDIDEPYRMLTSRSEYRLILRQDNADSRLTPLGYNIGLIDDSRFKLFQAKQKAVSTEIARLRIDKLPLNNHNIKKLANLNQSMDSGKKLADLLKRPNIDYMILKTLHQKTQDLNLPREIYEQAEIEIKYEGYLKRQQNQIDNANKLENIKIPDNINYRAINQISTETKDKLEKIRPKTLGQATRIGGVKPADISVLMVFIESKKYALIN